MKKTLPYALPCSSTAVILIGVFFGVAKGARRRDR